MIVVTGTVRIPADRLEEARPHMRAVVGATRAEDGCLFYSFGEDVAEPGLIVVAEAWRDGPAIGAHLESSHFAAWRAVCERLGVSERNLTVYEATSCRPL